MFKQTSCKTFSTQHNTFLLNSFLNQTFLCSSTGLFQSRRDLQKGVRPFGTVWNPICYSSRAQNHHHQHHSPPSLLSGQVFHFGNKTAGKQGKNWVLRAAGLWRLFFEPLTLCLLSSSPISHPNWDSCLTLLKLFG